MKNWTPYVTVWAFFALVVVALAAYRKMLSNHEDDSLHVSEGTKGLIADQIANANRIAMVEKWGKTLTAIVVVAGLILAGIYFWGVWQAGATGVEVQ